MQGDHLLCGTALVKSLVHFGTSCFFRISSVQASRQIVRKITKQGEIEADMERGSKSNNEIDFDRVPLLSHCSQCEGDFYRIFRSWFPGHVKWTPD